MFEASCWVLNAIWCRKLSERWNPKMLRWKKTSLEPAMVAVVSLIIGNFVVSATFQDLSFTMMFLFSRRFQRFYFILHPILGWEWAICYLFRSRFLSQTTLIFIKVRESLMRFVRFTLFSFFWNARITHGTRSIII